MTRVLHLIEWSSVVICLEKYENTPKLAQITSLLTPAEPPQGIENFRIHFKVTSEVQGSTQRL